MSYQNLNLEQIKILQNAIQLFSSLEAHRLQASSVAGSMHWKKINGKQYLYRAYSYGKNRSLGARSVETETIKQQFEQNRLAYKEREAVLREQVKLHAAYIKANQLNRFPVTAARVIRAFQQQGVPCRVVGTNALYAYEVVAGVNFQPELVATNDMGLLVDARQGVKIVSGLKGDALLSLLQKTDRTFQRLSANQFEFTAANQQGYQIDFITQGSDPILEKDAFEALLQEEDLHPVSIDSLKWAISSPHYDAVVFDTQGMPVRLPTIDPRAFVLHKWFTSRQPDRNRLKQKRDYEQARVMVDVLHNELTHLPVSPALAKVFPDVVQQGASGDFDGFSL